jgi:catechol 2,3-dioxygenase
MSSADEPHRSAFGIAPAGFRLPDDTHVGAVRLQVSDLRRSLAYYEKVLGFRVPARTGSTAALAAHGDDRVLVWLHEKKGVTSAPGAIGLYHFAILVPDRAELGRFSAHLARLDARVGMADHLVSEALYLWDPDGLGIEVYADRPKEEWQQDGRQLVMTTDTLNVRSLLAAAGGREWAGMPAGSTIGHVHLHVGDLPTAEAFYHRALGFDKTVWDYPGALFMSAGGYHHHLGTNTWAPGPPVRPDQAQLLEWELVVPFSADAVTAAESLRTEGYSVEQQPSGWLAADPWGTHLRIVPLVLSP